jgi:hypothetical protein
MSVVVLSGIDQSGSKLVSSYQIPSPEINRKKESLKKEREKKKEKRIRKHVDNFVPTRLAQKDNNNNNNNNNNQNNNNNK